MKPFECCFECKKRYGTTKDHPSCHSSCEDYKKSVEQYAAEKEKLIEAINKQKAFTSVRTGYLYRKDKLGYYYRGK